MRRLRLFKGKQFLPYLAAAMIYPVYAYITGENRLLKLIDAMTITGFIFMIFGVIWSLVFHGDFDITGYVLRRGVSKGNMKPFRAWQEDKQEERKENFNYPFWTGVLLLIIAAGLVLFVY